ncbi:MAG: methyltransferase [Bacteroidetes bacterium]|nr:MAG: methyltransferase [Bacteroidota bacterium]
MNNRSIFLTVKDHSVSGEEFQLMENETYGFLETTPQPKEEMLSEYYKTEDYISHTDTKRNLFEKAYHLVRSLSLKRKLKLINSLGFEKKNLLDIGCGTGDFLKTAKHDGWTVSGIEPNENARQIANTKTDNEVYDVEQLLKFKKQSFDVITLWHVLEHLPKLDEQLSILKNLLKEKGTLIIAVPNHKSFDATHYNKFWAAYDAPRHLWHFNQISISKLFASINMKVIKTLPLKFDAYYVSLLSEKNRSGFVNPLKAFWIGLLSNLKAKQSKEYSSLIYIIENS